MQKRLLPLILFLYFIISTTLVKAEKVYDFNSTCVAAYKEILCLKIANGEALIAKARKQNPDNVIPDFLEGYTHFFTLFFNEDAAEYAKRKPRFEEILSNLSQADANTPLALYCKSVVHLQKAVVAIKFNEKFSAAWDLRKASQLIKENKKKYPNFSPNAIIYGPIQVAAGIIPDGYKWLASIFGIKGSIKAGMQSIRGFVSSKDYWGKLMYEEAVFYYCYLSFYAENKQDEVMQFVQSQQLDVVNNHLFAYLASNLAINSKRNEYAKQVLAKRNNNAAFLQSPVWNFEQGYTHLHRLEFKEAIEQFEIFIQQFRGNFYVKDIYQKISWCYYLLGNKQYAEQYRKLAITKGNAASDADKKAFKEAKAGIWPNTILLKARLLNDGGYSKEALAMLHGKSNKDFEPVEQQLEFVYRVARIYDDLQKTDEALNYYWQAFEIGKNRPEYFAARAALQAGLIYEKKGEKDKAIEAFKKCLSLEDHDFKDSLDQRAKSGIARCNGL